MKRGAKAKGRSYWNVHAPHPGRQKARGVDHQKAPARPGYDASELRRRIRDLSLVLTADASLIAARIEQFGPDAVDGVAIFDHAQELIRAQARLFEVRGQARAERGGGA